MFKAFTLAAILAAVMMAPPLWSQEAAQDQKMEKKEGAKEGKVSHETMKFAEQAAAGGMMEVQLGQLATEKAASEQVKQFGQRMVQDHGKANEELTQLAAQKGITLPKELPEKQRKDVEKLSKLSGEEFDKAYMKTMVRDHKKDVKDFEKASKDLADADLKGWAAKTLPTLEEHLKLAEQTAGQTKQEGKEGGETTGSVKRM